MMDSKEQYVQRLFSNIAPNYDRLNGIISLGLHQQWRKFAISKAQLTSTSVVLDLCTGTADLAICAAKEGEGIRVIGLDFCDEMLEIGKEKIKRLKLADRVELKKQEVSALPFQENTFDVVTIGFGLRHLNIEVVLREIHRVLKPGGRLITLDAGRPNGLFIESLHKIYFYYILPIEGRIFHGDKEPYNYLPKSLDLYLPDQQGLKELMEEAGFGKVEYFNLLFGAAAVHLGFKAIL